MNYRQNYFDFSSQDFPNGSSAMTNQFYTEKCPVKAEEIEQTRSLNTIPCEQFTTVKSKKFSFLWTITNFEEFMDRKYEFTSPIYSENLSSGTSKWRMILHPHNIYPEGVHVGLRLLLLSEVDRSYSTMYTISFIDESGKHHLLKTREKVFRHSFDFDECPIISNISLKNKYLLSGKSLVIKCEFDLLECGNLEDITCEPCGNLDSSAFKSWGNLDSSALKSCGNLVSAFNISWENSDSSINRSCKMPNGTNQEKINVPFRVHSMNDLSYSESYKKPSDSEKDMNALVGKDSLLENNSGEFDAPNCKIQGLEILSDDMKHLYYNTSQHDVVIYADDGKHTAHEIILTSRSDYFKKALISERNKEINVPGINAETLDAVLYYLYTGKLKQMSENSALDLLKASKVFELSCLENMTTETFLCSRIRTNNVTNVFLMAKELKIESLKNSALKFIAEHREEVIKTQQWNELMRSDPHSAGEVLLTLAYYQSKVANNACSM